MRYISWLNKHMEELLLGLSMLSFVFIMGLQVFMRYVMNNSLAWPEELSRYIFIWFTFIGVSYAVKNNSHLRVDIILNYLPKKLARFFELIGDIFFFAFSIVVLIAGINVFNTFLGTMQTSPSLSIPLAIVYLSVPVGFAFTMVRLIQNNIKRFKGIEVEREETTL
ncbi:TRAP transporter small permease [Oceanobacillus profundus]|uniref:TRAP transporter small permease n=1 Tax=Oceanobacillus TaxID=182709 RepID=UPI0026E2FE3E|nr:TRAP transporter small permease [Oceanobacillus profundus]MBR3118484.1 TRAP transporter small permease [Oceanobacillus sp.]MDO6447660.1 TRAP transporter small permease [Oceanobacillus profundus]